MDRRQEQLRQTAFSDGMDRGGPARKKNVAVQDGGDDTLGPVKRGPGTPPVRAIDYVVMNERGKVDGLNGGGGLVKLLPVRGEEIAENQNDPPAQLFAPGAKGEAAKIGKKRR